MKAFEESAEDPKFANRDLVEIAQEDDGTHSVQSADIEAREYLRIISIRQANIQKLLEAILEQNRKGVKTKAELSVDLVSVPPLSEP